MSRSTSKSKRGLNESAFRKPYGKSRHALKISVTEDFMNRLQEYVTVSKGGFGSGFIQTATELMFAILDANVFEMEQIAKTMNDAFQGDKKRMMEFEVALNTLASSMFTYRAWVEAEKVAEREMVEEEEREKQEEKEKNMTPLQLEQVRGKESIKTLDEMLVPYE